MMILTILRYFFFFISILGWMMYLHKKLRIKAELLPLITATLTILVLFASGLLGLMLYAVLGIFMVGAMLCFYYLYKRELVTFVKEHIIKSVGFWFFVLLMVYFTIRFQQASLEHYDDFSHWATIVKEMWMFDWLPNFNSDAILFKTYPPGSALYVYYVVRVLGLSEPNLLIGQFYLMLTPVLAMTALLKDKVKLSVGVLFALTSMLIVHPAPDTLLVDTLLALMGLAVITVIFYYRNDIKKATILSAPVMMTAILIKNSGVLFAVFGIAYLLYLLGKQRKACGKTDIYLKNRRTVLIGIAVVLSALVLWKAHTNYVFPYFENKHTMSLSYFFNTFVNKNATELIQITSAVFNTLKDVQRHSTMVILVYNGTLLIATLVQRFVLKRKAKGIIKTWIIVDAVFVLYFISVLGMYLFSMPIYEALMLAGFDRYMNTILVFILGIIIIGFLYDSHAKEIGDATDVKGKMQRQNIYAVMISILLVIAGSALIAFDYQWFYRSFKKEGTIPQMFVPAIEERKASDYSIESYAYYITDQFPGDDDYFSFVATYRMFSKGKRRMYESIEEEENFAEALQTYDYFVILVEDEEIIDFMDDYIMKDSYIGTYDTAIFADDDE